MKKIIPIVGLVGLMAQAASGADPALTIDNQNFAVVRDAVPLDLKPRVNESALPARPRTSSRTR